MEIAVLSNVIINQYLLLKVVLKAPTLTDSYDGSRHYKSGSAVTLSPVDITFVARWGETTLGQNCPINFAATQPGRQLVDHYTVFLP